MTLVPPRTAVDLLTRFGKPLIEGTRVPVSVIVDAVAARALKRRQLCFWGYPTCRTMWVFWPSVTCCK
jgi:uncharacterized protein (DUF433 family)